MAGRPIRISVIADADKARREVASFASTAKKALGAGIAIAAGAGVKELLGSFRDLASESQQSLGATESVFGKYADTVIRRSKNAADAVGLSANEYRELANVTGAMLQNAGTPIKRVTDLTGKLTKRAADLAATYGGTTREAIESVNSLLRGEADPIEKYGVSIKQSDINARLAAKGLDKLEGSAKKTAEQQARLDLLFKQTSKAGGQFARETNTLAGQQQRFNAEMEDAKAAIGTAFLPMLTDLTRFGRREVVPVLQDFATWLEKNQDEITSTARDIGNDFLPVLKTTSNLVGFAVDVLREMPEPLRQIVLQGSAAALVLPKFTGAMTMASTGVGNFITNARNAETRTAALANAARTAAGVGGMVALAQGAQTSNKSVSGLLTTLGGAATGFAVAGPIGALVGGLGGLTVAAFQSKDAAEKSVTSWQTYASTLDNVTGATTRATEAMVIQELRNQKVLNIAGQLGIDRATLVSGILGEKGARDELSAAIAREAEAVRQLSPEVLDYSKLSDEQNTALSEEYLSRQKNLKTLQEEVGEVQKATQAKREDLLVLAGFPDVAITRIETPGAVDSKRELADLAATYKLTPKQIQTAIEVIGRDKIKASKAEVVALQQQLIKSGNVKPGNAWSRFFSADLATAQGKARTGKNNLNGVLAGIGNTKSSGKWKQGFQIDLSESTRNASKGKTVLERVLGDTGKNVKPNLAPFGRSLGGKIQALQGPARSKGDGVGSNMGAGMYGGLNRWAVPLAARAYQIVREAIAAANRAGDIHSPSLETDYTGRMLGEGLAQGIQAREVVVTRAGEKSGKAALKGIMRGVEGGLSGIDAALDRVTKLVEKRITGKNQGKREKAVLRSLLGQYNALRANGRAQDALASGNYLPYLNTANAAQRRLGDTMRRFGVKNMEEARAKLQELRDQYADYAKTIKDTIASTGDVTQLGRQEDGSVSITGLLNELENKAARAERFDAVMRDLAARGLSKEQIDQMLAAGPESALATAEAISFGGAEAIKRMNELQNRLGVAGNTLSKAMADRYYKAGVDAAAGMVKGLESQSAQLDRIANSLANALVKAVKRQLKIKSPSRVFMGIGDNVVKGLDIGLDDTYVKRSGSVLASSLQKGFGTPALDALTSMSSGGGGGPTVTLRLTAEQLDRLARGREIIADIDYARQAGVRSETLR